MKDHRVTIKWNDDPDFKAVSSNLTKERAMELATGKWDTNKSVVVERHIVGVEDGWEHVATYRWAWVATP